MISNFLYRVVDWLKIICRVENVEDFVHVAWLVKVNRTIQFVYNKK